MFENIVLEVAGLLGFAALVSMLVCVLKFFDVIKDGQADKWVAGFNLVGVLSLFIVRQFNPEFDPVQIDTAMGQIASIGTYILSFLVMIYGSKITYSATKGLPLIGKSFSKDKQDGYEEIIGQIK